MDYVGGSGRIRVGVVIEWLLGVSEMFGSGLNLDLLGINFDGRD